MALLHPDDGAERGLADGGAVRLTSGIGEVIATARFDESMRRGSTSLPHGFADPAVGVLTSGQVDVDPLTGMVRQSGLRVRVAPAVAAD